MSLSLYEKILKLVDVIAAKAETSALLAIHDDAIAIGGVARLARGELSPLLGSSFKIL